MCCSGISPEYSFEKDQYIFWAILFRTLAHEGQAFEMNKAFKWISFGREDDTSQDRLRKHSGKMLVNQFPFIWNVSPAGGPICSPIKQTGIYEKGDRN